MLRSSRRLYRWLSVIVLCAIGSPAAWCHPGTGIVIDDSGQVFFVHGARNRSLKLDAGGELSTLVDGTGGRLLINPHHLVLVANGTLYTVGDRPRVRKIGSDGSVATVAEIRWRRHGTVAHERTYMEGGTRELSFMQS
jgi:hypothetical protein